MPSGGVGGTLRCPEVAELLRDDLVVTQMAPQQSDRPCKGGHFGRENFRDCGIVEWQIASDQLGDQIRFLLRKQFALT
jgi:hypothetical protein